MASANSELTSTEVYEALVLVDRAVAEEFIVAFRDAVGKHSLGTKIAIHYGINESIKFAKLSQASFKALTASERLDELLDHLAKRPSNNYRADQERELQPIVVATNSPLKGSW